MGCTQLNTENRAIWYYWWIQIIGSVLFEVGNKICSVLLVGDTGEWHFVTGDMFSGGTDISEQVFITPDNSTTFHGLAVREISSLTSLSTDKLAQGRGGSIFTITLR